ncbi:hypothetical protein RIR_jg35376.t1 [Rhizophagus irregularis DAOM 181602=DAOM 197198]|nr:hypothetical protein RIR_jg35376.t1 [Rhizophagus irregularis DAOM 181602=DAOM 197198]
MKPDFKVTLRTPACSRNQTLRFGVSKGLPKNGKWRTKVLLSGDLPKNGKQKTKVPSGGLLKNGKWRTKVRKFWVSRVSSEKWKKPKFVLDLGWVSEERKKKTNLNGLDLGSLSYMEFRRSKTRLDPISKVYFGNQFLSSI